MEEWKEYKYTDLCFLIGGGTPKTSEPSYWEGNIPWLSVKDFGNDDKYVYKTEKTITEAGLNNSSTKLLQKDDIIISARGTIGAIAMLASEMAFNQSCFGIRSNGIIEQHYLYYLTKTKISELQKNSHGSVFDTITRDTFAKIDCIIPPLEYQKRVSLILSSLDDKIEVNRRINENLEQQAQALFKSWFVDFEPFRDGEFVESELGMIPKGWRVGTLGELITTNKRSYKGVFSEPIQYLDTSSITNNYIDTIQYLNPNVDKIPSRARRAVTEGDIVFSSVRPNQRHYGLLFNPIPNLVVSTGFVVITSNWSAYRYFLYSFLTQDVIIGALQAIAEQSVSTFPSINASDIENLKLIIPPDKIIGNYAQLCEKISHQSDVLHQESRRLATLRDTLLPKLMSGELKVNDVDIC